MRISSLPDFLRLTKTELALVEEIILENIDLCIKVNKGLPVTNIDADGIETRFDIYTFKLNLISYTVQMKMDDEVEYQSLLNIVSSIIRTDCDNLTKLSIINCNLGVDDNDTQYFFADLQHCRNLTTLNLADNALWAMSDWCNVSDMFQSLRLTDLDLSSNSLFDLDVWEDDLEEETPDYTETWSDTLSVLTDCNTLKTLNLAQNNVENTLKYCPMEMTTLLTHMIVACETTVCLADNDLSYLTPHNLQRLIHVPPASASENTDPILSKEEIEQKLRTLIEKEIKIHDEFDFEPTLTSIHISSSAMPSHAPSSNLKQNASSVSLASTTDESLSPPAPSPAQAASSCPVKVLYNAPRAQRTSENQVKSTSDESKTDSKSVPVKKPKIFPPRFSGVFAPPTLVSGQKRGANSTDSSVSDCETTSKYTKV